MSADPSTTQSSPSASDDLPTELLNSAKICTIEALARFAGDQARYRHWLVEFIDHGPAATAQIKQSISNGSHEATLKLVHALKGRTGMLGMSELHSITQTLEMTLRNREPAALWLDELELSVNEMSQALSAALVKTSK